MSVHAQFTPKSLTASEYVLALFDPPDNVAVLLRDRSRGQTVQRITTAEIVAGPEFQSWMTGRNRAGSDAFIGMNPIKRGSHNRTKESIKEIRHVYLDLDTNASEALGAIRRSVEVPAPNFVLDTSPGKHQVVWKIDGVGPEQAESLLRALASQFDGDPAATDSTRVLRLPGFANCKISNEFIVQVRQETDAVYTLRDFTVQQDSPDTPRHLGHGEGRSRSVSTNHKSQSEQDWAYAKRALARGDHPQNIIRNIADFRAEDKHDPQDYARRTVNKAQSELHANNGPSNSSPYDSAEVEREL
jgi:DNA primase RepB-like protein